MRALLLTSNDSKRSWWAWVPSGMLLEFALRDLQRFEVI